jgi:hypothetical protein
VLFIVVAWALPLVLGEIVVRIVYWVGNETPPTHDASLEKECEWARAHLRAGKAVFESEMVFDADTGWRNKPNLNTETIRTNAQGMRNEQSFEKQPTRKRLLLVGDSYTFGANVPNEETFAHVLAEEYLEDWDVLNMAVPGTGTDQQLITFERRGKQYRPDIVVLGFFVRDYSRNILSFRGYAKPRFVLEGDGLRLTNHPVIPPEKLYEEYAAGARRIDPWGRSYVVSALAKAVAKQRDEAIATWAPGWQVLSRLMERFKSAVEEAGAVPVWLVIPYRDVLTEEGSKFEKLELMGVAHSQKIGLPCLRLAGPFREFAREHPNDPVFRPKSEGGHLAAAGHRVAAESLFNLLSERGLLPSADEAQARQGAAPE